MHDYIALVLLVLGTHSSFGLVGGHTAVLATRAGGSGIDIFLLFLFLNTHCILICIPSRRDMVML